MKRIYLVKNIFFLTVLLVVTFASAIAGERDEKRLSQRLNGDPSPPKFALLIGITNYRNKTIPRIDGCENNVPALAETLIKDYGFQNKNVLTLVNEKASKKAIIATFRRHLIGNAKKVKKNAQEAVIVYYFCGHGSQILDQDGDENDGKDETFVAYDSRTEQVFDLLDDELDDLKSELRIYTSNTTLILESCHSGTGTRGDFDDPRYISQEIDADDRKGSPYRRKYPPTSDLDALTYTEIAASLSTHTAKSESAKYCECKTPFSLMTKALIEGLKRADNKTTYRRLMIEVSYEVSRKSNQEPQVEGNRDAILFGGAANRAKPYIEIEKVLPDNKIAIRAGRIHGLKEGSQIAIYSSGSLTNRGNKNWLTNGVITKVGATLSIAQLPDNKINPKVKRIKNTSHVVLSSPVFGGGAILVELNSPSLSLEKKDGPLRAGIIEKLTSAGLFKSEVIKLVQGKGINPEDRDRASGIVRLRKGVVQNIFIHRQQINPIRPKYYCAGNTLTQNPAELRFPDQDKKVYYLDDGESGGTPLFGKTFDPAYKNLSKKIY